MSSSEAWSKYQVQLGYYNQLNSIRLALVAIRGSLEAADTMFDSAVRKMTSCVDTVENADIVLEDFNQYLTLLSDNYNIIHNAEKDSDTFMRNINTAFNKVEDDMEIVHAYMTYLHNYYLSAQTDEHYGRSVIYPAYTGEIFSGF